MSIQPVIFLCLAVVFAGFVSVALVCFSEGKFRKAVVLSLVGAAFFCCGGVLHSISKTREAFAKTSPRGYYLYVVNTDSFQVVKQSQLVGGLINPRVEKESEAGEGASAEDKKFVWLKWVDNLDVENTLLIDTESQQVIISPVCLPIETRGVEALRGFVWVGTDIAPAGSR